MFGRMRQTFAVLLQVGWHVSPAVFHKIKKVTIVM